MQEVILKKNRVFAIVPAAGNSLRFGGNRSKLEEEIAGMPVITRTVHALRAIPEIGEIVVPCRVDDQEIFERLLAGIDKVHFAGGGATRKRSVGNALAYISAHFAPEEEDLVLVHDGARCMVSEDLLARSIEEARESRAVSAGHPLSDSIKEVDRNARVVASMNRERVWTVQTPQVFAFSLLMEAHGCGGDDATDDASLVEALHPVQMILGDKTNIKITTFEDLELAQHMAAMRESARRN